MELQFLNKHNQEKIDGSIVVARTTSTGSDVNYDEQDCLYLWDMHRIFF